MSNVCLRSEYTVPRYMDRLDRNLEHMMLHGVCNKPDTFLFINTFMRESDLYPPLSALENPHLK